MSIKHFLQFNDLTRDEIEHIFARAKWIKSQLKTTNSTGRWSTARWS